MAKEIQHELTFLPDESVIKRAERVGYGKPVSTSNNDLYLTNMALIHVKKSIFGKIKEVIRYPLSDIRRSNDTVEVKLGRPDNVTYTLDVYFDYGIESFKLTWEQDVQDWIADITETITGIKVERKSDDGFEELIAMAQSANAMIKDVKKTFGIKSDVVKGCKCPDCGAPVSGLEGETVQCPYCGNFVTLETD